MKLSAVLGWIMNRVLLGVLFYIFFTCTALVLRLIGRDALDRNFRRPRDSYWVPKPGAVPPPERYERQF
jgi:hypothetical protein